MRGKLLRLWCDWDLICVVGTGQAQEKRESYSEEDAIRAGRLIDGKSDSVVMNALILVENDRIVSVSAGGTAPAGVEVVDLSKATVLPDSSTPIRTCCERRHHLRRLRLCSC